MLPDQCPSLNGRRRARLKAFAAAFAAAVLALTPLDAALAATLPEPVAKLLKKHRIPLSAVSLEVRALDGDGNNQPLLSINPQTPRNPASVIKLLTTLAALELLGPAYQWQTRYLADGAVVAGELRGDLIFQGGGDPFLTVEHVLADMLALRQSGMDAIHGEVVIDNSRFKTAPRRRAAFDGQPTRLYNVGADAALVNFSATTFTITPRRGQILVAAEPPLTGLRIVNRITAESGPCINRNAGWSYRIERHGKRVTVRFSGAYRPRCGDHSIARSLFQNTDYTHRLLTFLWGALGGELGNETSGSPRVSPAPADARELRARPSKPLADIITGINKFSNNVMARQLLLSIAAELRAPPATVAAGIHEIRRWLAAHAIAMPALALQNGAGLSRLSRASAAGLSALLAHGWRSPYRPEFLSSLPLAAIDGTMRKRLLETPLHGRARIKTGLVNGARGMAGYVRAADNRHYSVVMMIDSDRVNFFNGNAAQDALLRWVHNR